MKQVSSTEARAIVGLAVLAIVLWLAIFLPSWSLDFWQAWIYWLVFVASVTSISAYFLRKDQNLIESRLKVGPASEEDPSQKVIQFLMSIFFILLILIPSFDHRFHWSSVPTYLVIAGDVLVFLGLFIIFLVFRENTFTSVLIEVGNDQKVISTGPYRVVRHPMYSGALLMLSFTPIALGSYWGLLFFIPMFGAIALRIHEEEKFLAKSLPGYKEYCEKTRYRLIPLIW